MTDAGPYVLTGYWAKEYARVQSEVTELRAEVERLTLADRQWADHVKRLAEEIERLRARLKNDFERSNC